MFTGIIETTVPVISLHEGHLRLRRPQVFDDLVIGASIAVSGVCLTVTSFTHEEMTFDVVPETLVKTTLGSLQEGQNVNLERAMSASGRFDGHMVQGHVEGTGTVLELLQEGDAVLLRIQTGKELIKNIVQKGSVTIDGVSLTVASLQGDVCTIALVPHTLRSTTLVSLSAGDSVNIETDILVRTIRSLLPAHA